MFIPASLRNAILKEFHHNPLAGLLGIREIDARICDYCYFSNMRETMCGYISSYSTCKRFNNTNISPAGKLMPIEIMCPL